MRSFGLLVIAMLVIGSGYWAYHENYATRKALARQAALSNDIARAHGRIAMLEAEWAYLNRPERLEALVLASFDHLGLVEISPAQFSYIRQVPLTLPDQVAQPVEDLQLASDWPAIVAGEGAPEMAQP